MAYKMVYIPSMKYGLPACSLTLDKINYIQNYTLDKFRPAMGFDHGSPRATIHGPQENGRRLNTQFIQGDDGYKNRNCNLTYTSSYSIWQVNYHQFK
jgi:hypothetical protein